MPVELWGASKTVALALPNSPPGFGLFLLYLLLLGSLLYTLRSQFRQLSRRDWLWTVGLSVAGFLGSQLFPLPLTFLNLPAQPPTPMGVLVIFATLPFLLAATILNPAAALIVGLSTGLGRALGQSHQIFDLFNVGFTAVFAALLLQQNYDGRLYRWLREPLVVGPVSGFVLTFFIGLSAFVSVDGELLSALDQALVVANAAFWPRLLEGLLAGGVVRFILHNLPHLRPQRLLVPSPAQRSLQRRLTTNYVVFVALLIVLSTTVVYMLAIAVSTRLVVNQMEYNASTVSAQIPEFQSQLQRLVDLFEADRDQFLSGDMDEKTRALGELYRVNPVYRRMLLVDSEGEVAAFFPNDTSSVTLSSAEETAVADSFVTSTADIATAETSTAEEILSFVVPLRAEDGTTEAVVVGRMPDLSTQTLIVGLQGTVGGGTGFIVNEDGLIIAHPDSTQLRQSWPAAEDALRPLRVGGLEAGQAYLGWQQRDSTRELVYALEAAAHPWTVVTSVPYAVVLDQAWRIGWPLLLVLLVGTAVFYANVAVLGRDIARPITDIVEASKTMAAGGNWSPSHQIRRNDEIGQLNQAFAQMQRSMRKQLNELSLLLGVSHDVSTSIDINQGIPAILRGALRGTGAAGARAVVLNPSGGNPLSFGEGPAADDMAMLDRRIMTRLRHAADLMLATPNQIRATLELDIDSPVPALLAIPMHSHDRFQGILWLGYRQAHSYDLSERNLLVTLASQAAVLVENARLYATAEGGRRRLAAVLASTSDAVVVTDQTERILLLNRAAERIFDLKASEVSGRPVADVIPIDALVDALTGSEENTRNLEIPIEDSKTYYASASTIVSNDGQIFGRVAVLRDITHLKEIDEMKSDFVATVSHDLRSPLTFMRGYATMLPMVGEMSEKQREYSDKILNGIDQMSQLVDDLLDLGRIEAGVDLAQETIDVEPLLNSIAEEYWQHAHVAGIKLHVEVDPDVTTVTGDSSLIRQALTNLVGNGIKYAPNSGAMYLRAEQHNGEVVISVQDNGPGIPKQEQMRLFEKFYRVKQRGTEKVKGSGLGLAIVKSIAERHGGRVWLQSQQGQGCTFFVSVPESSTAVSDPDHSSHQNGNNQS